MRTVSIQGVDGVCMVCVWCAEGKGGEAVERTERTERRYGRGRGSLTEDLEEAGEVVGPEGDFDGIGVDGAGGVADFGAVEDLAAVR